LEIEVVGVLGSLDGVRDKGWVAPAVPGAMVGVGGSAGARVGERVAVAGTRVMVGGIDV
jgi:hypothetical protein